MAATNGEEDAAAFLTKRLDLQHSERSVLINKIILTMKQFCLFVTFCSWIPSLLSVCVSHFGSPVKGLSDVASEAFDNAVDLATSALVTNDPGTLF